MHIAHSNIGQPVEAQPKKLSKKQAYHERMVEAMNRKRYQDFEAALKDPEVIAMIKKTQKTSPGWMPKFKLK